MQRNISQKVNSSGPITSQASPMYTGTGMNQPPTVPQTVHPSGLYVFGEVTDRSRRTISTRDNSTAEIVTYTVQDIAGHRYYIDEYAPERYNDVGSMVEMPVYVKTFKKRNGEIGHSFCVQQQFNFSPRGERF